MADHVRTQIREAVVAEVTGLASTGSRVHDSRVWTFEDDDLPAISVKTTEDELDEDSEGQGLSQTRHCLIVIEARVKSTDDYAAKLDNIDKEITEALADATEVQASTTLKSLVSTFEWRLWSMEIIEDQDKPLLLGVSEFMAIYKVNASDLESVV